MVEFLRQIGLVEATQRLPDLCAEVADSGQPIIISRWGQPLAEIRPLPNRRLMAERSEAGILECLRQCEGQFGPLNEEFAMPEWPLECQQQAAPDLTS